MKRKDLYNYIREEIVNTLSEETIIATPSGTESDATSDQKASATKETAKGNTVKFIKKGAPIKEMARKSSTLKIGNAEKFAAAKELYDIGWISKLLDLVSEAGETGITPKELAEKLGKKDTANISPAIRELKSIGAISGGKEEKEEPEVEEPEVEKPEVEKPETEEPESEEEPEKDEWEKGEAEEETPEIEPKMSDIKKAEKIISKGHAKELSPEEEEKYSKLKKGIEAKITKLSKLSKAKRLASDDMKILKQLTSREDVKKLFKDKGVSLKDLLAKIL